MATIDHTTRAHALLAASRADRWMHCTPSARLEEQVPDKGSSKYAEEGTVAHEISELMIRTALRWVKPEDASKELQKLRKSEYYNPEIEEAIIPYKEYVLDQYVAAIHAMEGQGDPTVILEEPLDFSRWVPDGFGTGDALIIANNVLEVIDLKYGKGVEVFAENNPQLMLYGLGALEKYDMLYDIETVKLTIVQPRLNKVSSWEIPVSELYIWGDEQVKPKAAIAYEGKGETAVGHWCKFCKVKARCAKMADENMDLAKHDFCEPKLLSMNELLEVFEQIPLLQDWANSVQDYLLGQALEGKEVPGYKVVAGRTMRKWSDEETVKTELLAQGFTSEAITKTKLVGIPDIEKLVGKKKFPELFGHYVVTPQGAPTLVPETDKRPALNPTAQAKADFSE